LGKTEVGLHLKGFKIEDSLLSFSTYNGDYVYTLFNLEQERVIKFWKESLGCKWI